MQLLNCFGCRVLVGAPKAEAKGGSGPRPGAVYNCPIAGSSKCQYLELDEKAVPRELISFMCYMLLLCSVCVADSKTTSTDVDRSDQLFGQTLVSSKGNIVVS